MAARAAGDRRPTGHVVGALAQDQRHVPGPHGQHGISRVARQGVPDQGLGLGQVRLQDLRGGNGRARFAQRFIGRQVSVLVQHQITIGQAAPGVGVAGIGFHRIPKMLWALGRAGGRALLPVAAVALDLADEPAAERVHGLDVARCLRMVTDSAADLGNDLGQKVPVVWMADSMERFDATGRYPAATAGSVEPFAEPATVTTAPDRPTAASRGGVARGKRPGRC